MRGLLLQIDTRSLVAVDGTPGRNVLTCLAESPLATSGDAVWLDRSMAATALNPGESSLHSPKHPHLFDNWVRFVISLLRILL
jgi:hypothetical protein